MKRIALLVCGMLLVVGSNVETRGATPNTGVTYTRTAPVAQATNAVRSAQPARAPATTYTPRAVQPAPAHTVSYAPSPAPAVQTTVPTVRAAAVSYSTSTAQGVANIMASRGTVGHFGGNRGYEGCGSGGSAAAAYGNCCFANSGMATVDVGYARGANGMWFCCRRYR